MHKSVFLFEPVGDKVLASLKNFELDSVFLHHSNLTSFTIAEVKNSILPKTEIYGEASVFFDKDLLAEFPDAKPVEAEGKDTGAGLCPTHPKVREAQLEQIRQYLKLEIDGIWLNHIRYPTKWNAVKPEILDTCYCERCLGLFEDYIGEKLEAKNLEETVLLIDGSYYHEWLTFKCEQISSFVKSVKELIIESGNSHKLGLFVVPWEDKEFGAGIKRVVSQDFAQLSNYADQISPMLYHKMCGKSPEWIREKVEYFWNVGLPFLPIVQTESMPEEISTAEFQQVLDNAVASPSSGVCVFYLADLLSHESLLLQLQKFFAQAD